MFFLKEENDEYSDRLLALSLPRTIAVTHSALNGSSQIVALLGFGCDAASISFEILNFLEQVIPTSCLFRAVGFQQSGAQVLALVTLQSPGRRIETCR